MSGFRQSADKGSLIAFNRCRRSQAVDTPVDSLTTAIVMASDPTPPKGGMSLYANLLNASADTPGSISRAPVVFKQPETEPQPDDAAAKKQQLNPGIYA